MLESTLIKEANARFIDGLVQNDPGVIDTANKYLRTRSKQGSEKQGSEKQGGYIRTRVQEAAFHHNILTPIPITNDDLAYSANIFKPHLIEEVEPEAPGAVTVQFGKMPDAFELEGHRIVVYINKIETHKMRKNVDELRTWKMDIRQILLDKQKKDIDWEEDRRLINAVNTAIVAPNSLGMSGAQQWWRFSTGMTRENLIDGTGIMERGDARLAPTRALVNTTTRREIAKWGRDEVGGDFAEQILRDGWTDETFAGMRWLSTLKRDLVLDGSMYMFAEEPYVGKSYVLEDLTLYVKNEACFISCFMYKKVGGVIGNVAGVARADFAPGGLSGDGAPVTLAA